MLSASSWKGEIFYKTKVLMLQITYKGKQKTCLLLTVLILIVSIIQLLNHMFSKGVMSLNKTSIKKQHFTSLLKH